MLSDSHPDERAMTRLDQFPAGIDRRRLMGLTAVAGLGITTLSLRPAAAASSLDGTGGGGITVTATMGALSCLGSQTKLDITVTDPAIEFADDVRLMILDGWTGEEANVWVASSNRVDYNPQYAEFSFDDVGFGADSLCAKIQANQVGVTVGLFEDGQLVAQSTRFTYG